MWSHNKFNTDQIPWTAFHFIKYADAILNSDWVRAYTKPWLLE